MFNKIKNHFEYKRSLKRVKKELVEIGANLFPLINNTTSNALNFVNFLTHIMEECNKLEGDELITSVLNVIADKFETNESRLYEIVKYIATMSKEDLQKVLIHAMVETNAELDTKDE